MDPVVHFEMPYDDRERMVSFYQTAFGWQLEKLGPEMGGYVLATTAVADIGASMKKVAGAGGQVLGEPMAIPGVGEYVSFFDTEGNRVSMLQPLPRA